MNLKSFLASLVTEYFRNKQLSTEQIDESYHRISEFLRR